MNKFEIQSEIDNVTLELRSLMDEVKVENADVVAIRSKKDELEKRRAALIKDMAQLEAPVENKTEVTELRKVADAMCEKRSVTLNGTGTVNVVRELAKGIVKRTSILEGAKFFYGANAATKIPVWGTQLKADFLPEGATGTAKTNQLSVTSLDAKQALSSLPVSNMTLDLGAANLEAELPGLFAGAFSDLLADGMINGKSFTNGSDTEVAMVGLFGASNGTTAYTAAATVAKLAELARTLKANTYAKPCIIMSPTVYALFIADSSTNDSTKIYKESLIRDKMIEDVPVVLTAYAPSTGSGSAGAWADGDVIAVGGDLSNYAIGMAGELSVKAKDTASSTVTTFDATIYAAGKPVIASDFYQYKIDVA